MASDLFFNLLFMIVCFGLIYPPDAFIGAGFTIENGFNSLLGSEKQQFIKYHIKKSMLNLLIYSCFPIIYIFLLAILGYEDDMFNLFIGTTIYWKIFSTTSILAPLIALFEIKKWSENDYQNHPISKSLSKYCNDNNTWKDVAINIETEYRRIDILSIKTNSIVKLVVTENWIIKVLPFNILFTHQSDATLCVKDAVNYELSPIDSNEIQFLTIEVKSTRIEDPFIIRINSTDFRNLEDRLARKINILPNINIYKSIADQFIKIFKDTIRKNSRYHTDLELDQCIGCLQARPEIKLQKQCTDDNNIPSRNCTECFCRPMWCRDCITKWFVSRQDPEEKNHWLSCKCTCPMCRATFCVLDVSLLDNIDEE